MERCCLNTPFSNSLILQFNPILQQWTLDLTWRKDKEKLNNNLIKILNSFNLETNIHITLILDLIRTESTRYTINGSFGEIINKFQDRNIKNNIRTLERKKKKLQNNKYTIFLPNLFK